MWNSKPAGQSASKTLPAHLRLNLSVDEAALSLGISSRLCRTLVASGELPSHRIGRRVLISFETLAAWNRKRQGSRDVDGNQ
jgi:excisionase family DNA binding protein